MSLVSLEEIKNHLRITQDNEDSLLELYAEAASDYIGKYLNDTNYPAAAAIRAAALLIIGDLYQNREATTGLDVKENQAVQNLLHPYRQDIGI